MCVCMYVCMYACMHMCMYIYIYIHISIYMQHMYTYVRLHFVRATLQLSTGGSIAVTGISFGASLKARSSMYVPTQFYFISNGIETLCQY